MDNKIEMSNKNNHEMNYQSEIDNKRNHEMDNQSDMYNEVNMENEMENKCVCNLSPKAGPHHLQRRRLRPTTGRRSSNRVQEQSLQMHGCRNPKMMPKKLVNLRRPGARATQRRQSGRPTRRPTYRSDRGAPSASWVALTIRLTDDGLRMNVVFRRSTWTTATCAAVTRTTRRPSWS